MINNKKGGIGLLGSILIILVVGFIIWYTSSTLLAKSSSSALEPIKKWISPDTKEDLENKKNQERINNELLTNAENVYSRFETDIKNCVSKSSDNVCYCTSIDFTNLNKYILKVSRPSDPNKKILELLDSSTVPVGNKKSELGNFNLIPVDYEPSSGSPNDRIFYESDELTPIKISVNAPSITFSKDSMISYLGFDTPERFKGRMNNLNFIKIPKNKVIANFKVIKDIIVADDNDHGFDKC